MVSWRKAGLAAGSLLVLVAGASLVPGDRSMPVFTAVLVWVTAWYAWQTQQMVREMRAASRVQVLPRPSLGVRVLGPSNFLVRITNAGPGAALKLDVTLVYEPVGVEEHYVAGVLASRQSKDFFLRDVGGKVVAADLQAAGTTHCVVRLKGTCEDALGNQLVVTDSLDLKDFALKFKGGLWVRDEEPLERIAKALENLRR